MRVRVLYAMATPDENVEGFGVKDIKILAETF
jgi:hypothetical protein